MSGLHPLKNRQKKTAVRPISDILWCPCVQSTYVRYRGTSDGSKKKKTAFRAIYFWRFRQKTLGDKEISFGRNTFLRFRGNSFFEKFLGNSFFSSKGGRSVQKGGRGPPFLGKRGLPPIFWGAPAKFLIPKILTEFSFGIGMVNTKKYQPIPTKKYPLGMQL